MTNYKISIKANRNSDFADHYMTKGEFIKFAEDMIAYDQLGHFLDKYLEIPVEYTEVEDRLGLVPSREVSEDEWFRAAINYFEHDGGQVQVKRIYKIRVHWAPFDQGHEVFYMTADEFVDYARNCVIDDGSSEQINHAQDAIDYFESDGSTVEVSIDGFDKIHEFVSE